MAQTFYVNNFSSSDPFSLCSKFLRPLMNSIPAITLPMVGPFSLSFGCVQFATHIFSFSGAESIVVALVSAIDPESILYGLQVFSLILQRCL
jgi:hypothetical protein